MFIEEGLGLEPCGLPGAPLVDTLIEAQHARPACSIVQASGAFDPQFAGVDPQAQAAPVRRTLDRNTGIGRRIVAADRRGRTESLCDALCGTFEIIARG